MAALRNVCCVRKRHIFSISVLRSHHKSPVNTIFESPLELSRPSLSVRRNIWSTSRLDDFTKALSDAEKLVGYPTSFLNLRYLLSDEISNVAMYMKRFAMSKHPLLRTARGFISDENHTLQTRGLLVLLISKASRACLKDDWITDQDLVADIYSSQRQLADITETIYTANLVHTGIVNMSSVSEFSKSCQDDMEFGNRMAVLSGDFLLASACTGLAELRDTEVVCTISEVIGHLMEGEFLKITCDVNSLNLDFWNELVFKCKGSLMANSCKAALKLVSHSKELQNEAFQFGKNLAFAHQLKEELQTLREQKSLIVPYSAPVILACRNTEVKRLLNHIHLEKIKDNGENLHLKLADVIVRGDVVARLKELCQSYANKALQSLVVFPDSEAKQALVNITNSCSIQE
ncbi:all trans-polyprenyl-diphosphate synthase PDSS2-like [Acropora muricata]|uniref:all trans-polyprenyl-diphosphate synthase PDSS2-like n=1 Tax=Acropora muricata TaxID=159855 RepID=UPI001CF4F7DC|nr:all trans-polyprenyl-diphosphate synthase PDSS2-like isoform X1 [Acropora millepora]